MRHYCDEVPRDSLSVDPSASEEWVKIRMATASVGEVCFYTPEHAKEIARDIDQNADAIIAARPKLRYQEGDRESEAVIDTFGTGGVIARVQFSDARALIIDALNAYDKEQK